MIKINLKNLNRKRKVDLARVAEAAETALRALGLEDAEVNIVLVSNQKIRAMNRRYLGKDASTDVIAWPAYGDPLFTENGATGFLGDIAVSSDKAAANAAIYGQTFGWELVLYVIHGLLHLKGFDDRNDKDRRKMRAKEDELLQRVQKRTAGFQGKR
ncbi:MAG: rRNA maturation RNase YbeY [Candidatus Omnitrophica bacterium]|nr:rRNA maturation RNase YbeY [Candidatus Omnitrophota bacterium]